jgi:hypothetical protein
MIRINASLPLMVAACMTGVSTLNADAALIALHSASADAASTLNVSPADPAEGAYDVALRSLIPTHAESAFASGTSLQSVSRVEDSERNRGTKGKDKEKEEKGGGKKDVDEDEDRDHDFEHGSGGSDHVSCVPEPGTVGVAIACVVYAGLRFVRPARRKQ